MHRFRLFILLALCLCPALARGQEQTEASSPVEVGAELEFMNNYVWRGMATGHPYAAGALAVSWRGLTLGTFALTGLAGGGEYQELDFSIAYTLGGLSFGLNDYWSSPTEVPYFHLRPRTTGHTLEAFVAYDFGPLSAAWYTNVAGSDLQEDGRRAWSSYFELTSAEWSFLTCQWQAQLGISPWASDYYGTRRFSVCEVGLSVSRDIVSTEDFSIPLVLRASVNPTDRAFYFIFGFRFVI